MPKNKDTNPVKAYFYANPGKAVLILFCSILGLLGLLALLLPDIFWDQFIWRYVEHKPRQNGWRSADRVPTHSRESDMMSRDLKRRGFNFVGTRICYAFMQAVGMVNDHTIDCFRHRSIKKIA